MTTGDESAEVLNVVLMVKDLFHCNPRRLKLFLNAYRLSTYMASRQGLFEKAGFSKDGYVPQPARVPISLEQLGKVVAISMRCPELHQKLSDTPDMFGVIEDALVRSITGKLVDSQVQLPSWLDKPHVRELLHFGLLSDQGHFDPSRYQLRNFPFASFLSVMPFAPDPQPGRRATSAGLENLIGELAANLNSTARVKDGLLNRVAKQVISEGFVKDRIARIASGNVMDVLVGLAVAGEAMDSPARLPHYRVVSLASEYLDFSGAQNEDFVQYRALVLIQKITDDGVLNEEGKWKLRERLRSNLDRYERFGSSNHYRLKLAKKIITKLEQEEHVSVSEKAV
jgi:hypothetical protein